MEQSSPWMLGWVAKHDDGGRAKVVRPLRFGKQW